MDRRAIWGTQDRYFGAGEAEDCALGLPNPTCKQRGVSMHTMRAFIEETDIGTAFFVGEAGGMDYGPLFRGRD